MEIDLEVEGEKNQVIFDTKAAAQNGEKPGLCRFLV